MALKASQDDAAYIPSARTRIAVRAFGILIFLIGLWFAGGGVWLMSLGGSGYYLLAGLFYLAAAYLLWRLRLEGAWLVATVTLLTVPWALWESGTKYWALFPRLLMPFGLTAVALLLASLLQMKSRRLPAFAVGVLSLVITVVQFGSAFAVHDAVVPAPGSAFKLERGDNQPSDWASWGRTTAGTRYAPFDQVNRDNVSELRLAWTFHDGDMGPGVRQNTPLQIGNTLYTCSPNDHVTAIDADTGAVRWKHDAQASSPFWQRCRGLGYYKMPMAVGSGSTTCAERVFNTTIDARLIALDAKTGQPCADFGKGGTVDLKQGMGEVTPGMYFQTAAPIVARDYIIVGGWVADNREVGEPSGVVRAFDARTGALAWAWDLGNPATIRDPPEGQTYTRATPNMWTSPAYDDRLGLIYVPLGNQTPDYFAGDTRLLASEQYNASIVALDLLTGRERWKVQTVHHDIWDYDLPAQPALMDLPDGKGGTVPALMQITKRGQIFLLNRATGAALAQIAERPVPATGQVPGEKLSPTQPYSVGMPTIGAERLTEKKMWGATMLDQLYCRISFLQHPYEGDFTPPHLTPTIQQPGNAGGFNWGSVSYDPANHLAFVNDIRIPSELWLLPRDSFEAWAKSHPSAHDGHGPSPQTGLPYGEATYMWLSPIGVPCNEPPFGTLTAIDLVTRKVLWQIPAGTAEKLGPFGIPSHIPMPVGMPTYAGTLITAGGLVFFAGFQDYYLRAYDAQTGREAWKYKLPVGSSAHPMTYISPATGKQYIVLTVGGAAHSEDISDMVMAFALPDAPKK